MSIVEQESRNRPSQFRVHAPVTMPEITRSITLNTAYMQRLYQRYFPRLKADIYVLDVRTRANGLDEVAKAIEKQCDEEFETLRTELEREIARTEHLMKESAIAGMPTYELAQTLQAKLSTPRAGEFLDLILKIDQLLMRYDCLWLAGEIKTHVRMDGGRNWQRRLTKVANRLRGRANQARKKCDDLARTRQGGRARPSTTAKPADVNRDQRSPEGSLGADHAEEEEAELDDDEDLLGSDEEAVHRDIAANEAQ